MIRRRINDFLTSVLNYEFWPYLIFYFPMFFYGIYLAVKSRSATYFTTANPGMKFGGVMGESKYKVLRKIDPQYLPKTIFIPANGSMDFINTKIQINQLDFPMIIKPDIGERGKHVERINNHLELDQYFIHFNQACLIQEFINFDIELGILYYRKPGEAHGHISSVVVKDYLKVHGDGKSSLEGLVKKAMRARGRLDYLKSKYHDQLNMVLPIGTSMCLEPIGNHCRGTTFLNGNNLINRELEHVFDQIAGSIEGFYYGRFDVKVSSLDDLYAGKNIKILELNGVSSEPAHIYDPDNTLIMAYRDVLKHMRIIEEIACENHHLGHKRASLKDFMIGLKEHFNRT